MGAPLTLTPDSDRFLCGSEEEMEWSASVADRSPTELTLPLWYGTTTTMYRLRVPHIKSSFDEGLILKPDMNNLAMDLCMDTDWAGS